jgi:branched-chain amino acid transport system substrate-binding protein
MTRIGKAFRRTASVKQYWEGREMRRILAVLFAFAFVASAPEAFAQSKVSDGVVKLGVMTDMSGPYADNNGAGSVLAARMAVEDFGAKVLGVPVELIFADHQNKPDIALNIARQWIDQEKVDAFVDLAASSVALAIGHLAADRNRIILNSGSSTTRITNEECNTVTAHWTYDTYALGNGTAATLTKRGGKTWFFVTADYVFGQSLEQDATKFIVANGGKVIGSARHPFPTSDFSSFLLQAQNSGADVVALANSGSDFVNSAKQAAEFGLTQKQQVTGLLVFINDIHAIGLKAAQGMLITDGFYWDRNDETRAWSKRFFEQIKHMPTMNHAGIYSAVMHYLKAVQAAGTDEAQAVMAQMRAMPVNDMFATNGHLRIDGRMVHDMYLFQVKSPEESKGPWDYYKLVETIPGDKAFQPLELSRCPLVKKEQK